MASNLGNKVTEAWFNKSPWLWCLLPLSFLFFIISTARRWFYRRGWRESVPSKIPVVVVGNITVGGSGKSPLVTYLVQSLRQMGYQPGVVSRGYGAQAELSEPVLLSRESLPSEVGDEPLMLKLRLDCPVVVCRDRASAVARLAQEGCDIAIADDGLQHYRMQRDIEICVFDAKRLWGNGMLLPAGPLRESLSRLKSVDFVVMNGELRAPIGETATYNMRLTLDQPVNLNTGERCHFSDLQSGAKTLYAVAGIGNPQRFFSALEEQGLRIETRAFDDHHQFTREDFATAEHGIVLMTEKDAVKCRDLGLQNAYSVPVTASLRPDLAEQIRKCLIDSGRLRKMAETNL